MAQEARTLLSQGAGEQLAPRAQLALQLLCPAVPLHWEVLGRLAQLVLWARVPTTAEQLEGADLLRQRSQEDRQFVVAPQEAAAER